MPRKPLTTQTREQIRECAEDLAVSVRQIQVVAEKMNDVEITSLDVKCYDQGRRAREYARNYAAAVIEALSIEREKRGHFATIGSKNGHTKDVSGVSDSAPSGPNNKDL